MNIHKSQLFWGSLGTMVLTHPQIVAAAVQQDVHCLRQADKSLQDDKELGNGPPHTGP